MDSAILARIREELFYGSSDYTKSQPDLFLPHRFQMLAPSQVGAFLSSVKENLVEEELLLYVHLPFCFTECLFCNSFPQPADRQAQQEYLDDLVREIELMAGHGLFAGKRARCIYFGGGTPTAFANRDLKRIVDTLRGCIELAAGCSITCEAHPATLTSAQRVAELAGIGLTRISIGCQSFDAEVLELCDRSNSAALIRQVVDSLQAAGLAVNVDMMTGLPGQTLASVEKDLAILEEIRPTAVEYIRHEIVNPLAVNLYRQRPELVVRDDVLFEMVLMTQGWMERHGYEQNGRFTNDRQWAYRYHWLKEMPIIAFGARTRSYTKTLCYDKHEDLATYSRLVRKGVPPIGRRIDLTDKEQMYRSLILGLQIKTGLDLGEFRVRFGVDAVPVFGSLFTALADLGCLEIDAESVRLAGCGAYFVEDVCDFIIDAALREEPGELVRAPHSEGSRSARLDQPGT
jgi:oxygen-independent coproporphyrinogen-3 oxidase